MKRVTVHQAKTSLSKLLLAVSAGEAIEIARGGVPVARLVPIRDKRPRRKPGKYQNKILIGSDFDAPLPHSILKKFK